MGKVQFITQLVKNKKVYFDFYRDGELWYHTDDGFKFHITAEESKGGIFKNEDRAILFMRWIRKEVDEMWDDPTLASFFKELQEKMLGAKNI